MEKKCKKAKWLSGEALQIAVMFKKNGTPLKILDILVCFICHQKFL